MRASSAFSALGVFATLAVACSNEPRPAEWSYLSPVVFQPSCASQSCHSRAAAVAGLDFSDPDRGYKSLTDLWVWVPSPTQTDLDTLSCGTASGKKVCEQRLRPLVTPFDPNESRLVNMLRGRGANRMPPDRPLDEADIELVERWILDGARRNPGPAPDGGVADARPDGGPDAPGGEVAGGEVEGDVTPDHPSDGSPGDASADGSSEAGAQGALTAGPSDGWGRVSAIAVPSATAQSMFARLTLLKPVASPRAEAKFDNAFVAAHGTSTQLLVNPGFDHDLAGWMPSFDATAAHDAADATNDAASGSLDLVMSVGSVQFASTVAAVQCLPIAANTSYDFHADVFVLPGQSSTTAAGLDLWYYASTDCSGAVLGTLAAGSGAGH